MIKMKSVVAGIISEIPEFIPEIAASWLPFLQTTAC